MTKIRSKEEHKKLIELRKRMRNFLFTRAYGESELLLPIDLFPPDPHVLKAGPPPVAIVNVLNEEGEMASTDEEMKFLLTKINLDADLMTVLTDIATVFNDLQEAKGNPLKQRVHIDAIEQDLDMLELRNHGKTIEQIAQAVNPTRYKGNKKSIKREVKRCLNRVKEVIRRGF